MFADVYYNRCLGNSKCAGHAFCIVIVLFERRTVVLYWHILFRFLKAGPARPALLVTSQSGCTWSDGLRNVCLAGLAIYVICHSVANFKIVYAPLDTLF